MKSIQYTLRDIPAAVDDALRGRARTEGRSINATAVGLLTDALGLAKEYPRHDDLDAFAGSWVRDPACDAAFAEIDKVDEELWR